MAGVRLSDSGVLPAPIVAPFTLLESGITDSWRAQVPPSDLKRRGAITRRQHMLYYAVVFFVIAIVAAILGFGGIAAGAAGIAKILFFIFLILAIVTFLRRA